MGRSAAMPEDSAKPHPKSRRRLRRARYANRENREDYVRVRANPRIVGLPLNMLRSGHSMGGDYIAHAKAGATTIVVTKENGVFFYEHRVRVRHEIGRTAIAKICHLGQIPVSGRAGAVKFLQDYCERNNITYNKIIYGLVG